VKLTQIAVLLSGAALSASVFAADNRLGIPNDLDENVIASSAAHPAFNVDETRPATQTAVRFGDENDTSWLTPKSKPAFSSNNANATVGGIPHDLDENALAMGTAKTARSTVTANYGVRGNGAGL
jgi:hypothetical protein